MSRRGALAGSGWASAGAIRYADPRGGLPGAPGFALTVLTVTAAASAVVDLGRVLALAACAGALLGPATFLVVRQGRARAVVEAIARGAGRLADAPPGPSVLPRTARRPSET